MSVKAYRLLSKISVSSFPPSHAQALGIIVFVLLCGCLPFDDDSSRITSELVARKKFALRFPRWASNLSPSAKELMQRLLDVDPKTRITAEEALRHPWVTGAKAAPNNYLQSPSVLGTTGECMVEMTCVGVDVLVCW